MVATERATSESATKPTPRRAEHDGLLGGLDEQQRAAVVSDALPLAVIAGAGAGKTRVLTRRIAWRIRTGRADAANVLAVTFTRKAAAELTNRLRALGVAEGTTAGTIHSVALAQLRRRCATQGRTPPVVLERKARLLVPIIGGRGSEAAVAARDLAGEIEWAKARRLRPDDYCTAVARAGRTPPRPAGEVASIYERYEQEKRKRGLVDFDDLLSACAATIEHDPEFAAAQRWRFRHFYVDEFQDVSPAQLHLLRMWLSDRDDLCVVGDADQAIYAFAGAQPGHLTSFARHFPGGQVVRLDCNYRSTPEVLAVAEALLADADSSRRPRRAVESSGPSPTVTAFDTDDDEARGVVQRLLDAHAPSVPWSSLAVLYRTNAQSAGFEEALTRAGIPFRVRGDARFLERAEVRAALDGLREAANAEPGIGFVAHLGELERDTDDASAEQREHVGVVARLGREYLTAEGGPGSVDGFLAWLVTALRGDAPATGGEAVELLTFHRAKGLEFHTVFVTGLERGLVPIAHADSPTARAEERRLLYVAITRARHAVHLSYAKQRTFGTKTMPRQRSPWLTPIEAALPPSARPAAASTASRERQRGPDEARARLAAAAAPPLEGADRGLFDALVEWRRALARVAGVPAYVIFNDATLRVVAAEKPLDRAALLAVPGIGPVKLERHGDAVLDLVRQHAAG